MIEKFKQKMSISVSISEKLILFLLENCKYLLCFVHANTFNAYHNRHYKGQCRLFEQKFQLSQSHSFINSFIHSHTHKWGLPGFLEWG